MLQSASKRKNSRHCVHIHSTGIQLFAGTKKTHRKMTKHNKSSSFVNVVLNQCPWDGLRYTKHKTREKLSYEYISLYLNTYFAFLATISIYYT